MKGSTDTLPKLYALPAADFHDITSGNNGFQAGAGYDLVTGRGTPFADKVINDLVDDTTAPTAAGTERREEDREAGRVHLSPGA